MEKKMACFLNKNGDGWEEKERENFNKRQKGQSNQF